MKNTEYVYCTNCEYFRLCDEGLPYCPYENKCNINDCEDSKPFLERPYYIDREQTNEMLKRKAKLYDEINEIMHNKSFNVQNFLKAFKARIVHAEIGRAFEWAMDEGFELVFRDYNYSLDEVIDVEVIQTKNELLEVYRDEEYKDE